MLQAIASPTQLMPQTPFVGKPKNEERKLVFVSDLMKVSGLGNYQAGVYFRKIKAAANIDLLARYIHIDTFMLHLESACPRLKHITIADMKNVMV